MTKEKVLNEVRAYMSSLGKRSLKTMTPEQRKERARKAIQTRWGKERQTEQHRTEVIPN